ncbi:TraB/GumN family protein [Vibrio aestuarianus]|uniref:TraB/GumN family protein n=1 Tax=Vibrio aestuarianus TaxID=28171 RepID=UPI00237D0997|nr:TraB/GumN family protein [Vibrio aestuarianus]MDE1211496.1 TraB/GumN family protein [Vibrio aestuarianus]MDE1253778.1 TraB/GumN family protein [Vibrio aestuarianus]MDE1317582.1 TraB/GumN family protein [Vibrio aestuarianus]
MKYFLLVFSLLFSIVINAEPLYWQAKKGNQTLLIVGSIHVGDESMYPLPQAVTQFFESSDGLVVETDVRKIEGITYPPTQHLSKDVLNTQQLSQLVTVAKQLGLNAENLKDSPPWVTALQLQQAQWSLLGYVPDDGVDMRLMYKATINNKPIFSLEELQFQIDLLTNQPEDGKELLTSILDEWDNNEQVLHCLIESWTAGDQHKLIQFAELEQMSEEMVEAFITQRNNAWANKLGSDYFLPNKDGNYLVVVGTLHLVGKHNLIDLLTAKGFAVQQLSTSQTASCDF